MTLLEFKKSGPWIRIGDRPRAQRRFDAICKKPGGLQRLFIARDAYADEVKALYRTKTAKGESLEEIGHFVLHLCTWLTRWEDYFEERTETLHDEPELFAELQKVSHGSIEKRKPNPNLDAARDFIKRKIQPS